MIVTQNVGVKHGGVSINSIVIEYTREEDLCSAEGSITVTLQDNGREFLPWDVITISEEGNAKGTYYVSSIDRDEGGGTVILSCVNGVKKLYDTFVAELTSMTTVTTSKYWIERYCAEAGVSVTFNVSGTGAFIAKNTTFGGETVYDILIPLLQKSGWYMYFTPSGNLVISKLARGNSATVTNAMSAVENTNDSMARNRVVVYGRIDSITGQKILVEKTQSASWQYDGDDYRTVVFADSGLYSWTDANNIAATILSEFNRLNEELTVVVEGFVSQGLGERITIDNPHIRWTGTIMYIECAVSEKGCTTTLILDRRCPRLFGYFAQATGYVYIATMGNGVWRKPVPTGVWQDYSDSNDQGQPYAGLRYQVVTDLDVSRNMLGCVTAGGKFYTRTTADSQWKLFTTSGFPIPSGDTIGLLDFYSPNITAECCIIDDTDGKHRVGFNQCFWSPSGQHIVSGYIIESGGLLMRSWIAEVDYSGNMTYCNYLGEYKISDIESEGNIQRAVLQNNTTYNVVIDESVVGGDDGDYGRSEVPILTESTEFLVAMPQPDKGSVEAEFGTLAVGTLYTNRANDANLDLMDVNFVLEDDATNEGIFYALTTDNKLEKWTRDTAFEGFAEFKTTNPGGFSKSISGLPVYPGTFEDRIVLHKVDNDTFTLLTFVFEGESHTYTIYTIDAPSGTVTGTQSYNAISRDTSPRRAYINHKYMFSLVSITGNVSSYKVVTADMETSVFTEITLISDMETVGVSWDLSTWYNTTPYSQELMFDEFYVYVPALKISHIARCRIQAHMFAIDRNGTLFHTYEDVFESEPFTLITMDMEGTQDVWARKASGISAPRERSVSICGAKNDTGYIRFQSRVKVIAQTLLLGTYHYSWYVTVCFHNGEIVSKDTYTIRYHYDASIPAFVLDEDNTPIKIYSLGREDPTGVFTAGGTGVIVQDYAFMSEPSSNYDATIVVRDPVTFDPIYELPPPDSESGETRKWMYNIDPTDPNVDSYIPVEYITAFPKIDDMDGTMYVLVGDRFNITPLRNCSPALFGYDVDTGEVKKRFVHVYNYTYEDYVYDEETEEWVEVIVTETDRDEPSFGQASDSNTPFQGPRVGDIAMFGNMLTFRYKGAYASQYGGITFLSGRAVWQLTAPSRKVQEVDLEAYGAVTVVEINGEAAYLDRGGPMGGMPTIEMSKPSTPLAIHTQYSVNTLGPETKINYLGPDNSPLVTKLVTLVSGELVNINIDYGMPFGRDNNTVSAIRLADFTSGVYVTSGDSTILAPADRYFIFPAGLDLMTGSIYQAVVNTSGYLEMPCYKMATMTGIIGPIETSNVGDPYVFAVLQGNDKFLRPTLDIKFFQKNPGEVEFGEQSTNIPQLIVTRIRMDDSL